MSSKTVVESPQFAEERAILEFDVPRLDEILVGVTWALARDPRRFPQVRGTRLHRVLTDPFPDAPSIRVWYTYDILHQKVELLSIEQLNGDEKVEQIALRLASIGRGLAIHIDPEPAA